MSNVWRDTSLSLDEVLRQENMSLKQVLEKKLRPGGVYKKGRVKELKHIYKRVGNSYEVIKTINWKQVCFGTYSSVEDARIVRDELIKYDWDKDCLEDILKKNNIMRNKKGRKRGY